MLTFKNVVKSIQAEEGDAILYYIKELRNVFNRF